MSTVDESTPEKKAGNDNDNININGKEKLSILLLIITTILWGTSFIITRTIIEVIPPMFYMGLRFFMAGIAFIPFIKQFKKISKEEIKISFVAGFLYFVAIGTQTLGMTDINTTASKAGFLTGLNVILVPIFLAIFFREKISKRIWIAVVLAIIGTYILSSNNGINSISIGDILIIICAIFCAFYIIYLDRNVNKVNYLGFSMLQLFVVSGFSFLFSIIFEDTQYIFGTGAQFIFTLENLLVLIYMGIIVTSLTFAFQAYGQKHVSPTITAIIFALEPVFAAFFAIVFGPEILIPQILIGSAIIFIGILISIEKKK